MQRWAEGLLYSRYFQYVRINVFDLIGLEETLFRCVIDTMILL